MRGCVLFVFSSRGGAELRMGWSVQGRRSLSCLLFFFFRFPLFFRLISLRHPHWNHEPAFAVRAHLLRLGTQRPAHGCMYGCVEISFTFSHGRKYVIYPSLSLYSSSLACAFPPPLSLLYTQITHTHPTVPIPPAAVKVPVTDPIHVTTTLHHSEPSTDGECT